MTATSKAPRSKNIIRKTKTTLFGAALRDSIGFFSLHPPRVWKEKGDARRRIPECASFQKNLLRNIFLAEAADPTIRLSLMAKSGVARSALRATRRKGGNPFFLSTFGHHDTKIIRKKKEGGRNPFFFCEEMRKARSVLGHKRSPLLFSLCLKLTHSSFLSC